MRGSRRRLLRLLAPAAAVLAGVCWLENYMIETSVIRADVHGLPEAFEGLRIVQVSDLHGRCFGRNSARLLARVREARPDIIAITGDLADENTDLSMLPPLLEGLCAVAPVFYVTGNHEWVMGAARRRELFSMLSSAGVTRLENEYRLLTRGGETLVLAGVDDPNGPRERKYPRQLLREIRESCGADACIVMLSHRNDDLTFWRVNGVQLVLSGHAHGGIVRLPGVGAVFGTHLDLFPDFTEGLCRDGNTALVVSRGLGGNRKLPIRLNNRPELVTVILSRRETGEKP